jgi:endonuclease/exonuclease/phosphatase family metal-dependent hydrolase
MPGKAEVTLATYNVHRWIGADGRRDPDRVLSVIRELDADVVGLQEMTYPEKAGKPFGLAYIAEKTGMQLHPGPTLLRREGPFGNAVLTSLPVHRLRRIDLSMREREPRGALDMELVFGTGTFRVLVTHLGLRERERRPQVETLLRLVESGSAEPVVLMGDFNVWFPGSPLLSRINKVFGRQAALRTFPARWPLFRLDRIWVRPTEALLESSVHSTPAARRASDHLPLKAKIRLGELYR